MDCGLLDNIEAGAEPATGWGLMAFASGRKREDAQEEENGGENRNKTETAKM